MTKHVFGTSSKSSKGQGHPIMYGKPKQANWFEPFPDGGGYPKGFLEWAFEIMGVQNPEEVLHLCSGSVKTGIRVDIRPEMNPTICADCRNVPLPDSSVKFILADPPYDENYARMRYNTESSYPKPGEILKEAGRLLQVGGKIGLLHFIVPMTRKPLKMRGVYGITTGNGTAIRAWTLCEKVNVEYHRWRNGI